MVVETKRLTLLPLSARQLKLWLDDTAALERELTCVYQAEPLEGFFREIVRGQVAVVENDPSGFMWHTFWLLLRQSDRVVVGSADFKDAPGAAREVEIGYGLGKAFEHHGFMTEAVEAMCAWALRQENVRHVIAETEPDNLASQRILQRCGFYETSRGETIWWRR